MERVHKCAACGGAGCECGDWRATDGACWCATPCLACDGAGSLPEQMPISDAVADAETLRLNSEDYCNWDVMNTVAMDRRGVLAFVLVPGLRA